MSRSKNHTTLIPIQYIIFIILTVCISSYAQDIESPSQPEGHQPYDITTTSFSISWDPAFDNVGVVQYSVYTFSQNGWNNYQRTTATTISYDELSPAVYHVQVYAHDAAGNQSPEPDSYAIRIGADDGQEQRSYFFGHSLVSHTLGAHSSTSNIPYWLGRLATAGGKKWATDGQFGQPSYHRIPPHPQFSFDSIPSAWNQTFGHSDYTSVILTHPNFTQGQPVTTVYDGETPTESTIKILNYTRSQEPNVAFYIYENWPEGFPQYPPTASDMVTYHAHTRGAFHDWWVDLQDLVNAEVNGAPVLMIPVGPIISGLFQTIPALNTIPLTDIYEDDAPHGMPGLYFLAALIHYSALFEEPIPESYIAPNLIPQQIIDHYSSIRTYIWNELTAFNHPDGTSRVFPSPQEPLSSVESSSQSSSSLLIESSQENPPLSSSSSYTEIPLSSSSSYTQVPFSSSDLLISSSSVPSREPPTATQSTYSIGMNTGGTIDWNGDKPFADIIKTARMYQAQVPETGNSTENDSNGWPLSDFQVLVFDGQKQIHGTYAVRFEGVGELGSWGSDIGPHTYDPTTNITSTTLTITNPDTETLIIAITNTQDGVKNLKMMRPVSPGSSESHRFDEDFSREYIERLAPYSTIRFMGWTNTNGSNDSLWEQTVPWNYASQHVEHYYSAWESIIKLANATKKDAWICVPHKVTDQYMRNLAILFRDGSTSVEPLNSTSKLYVEYSNEVWNWGGWFPQTQWVYDQAQTFGHPLDFDGESDPSSLLYRYKAMRSVTMSTIFREVFGDDRMMSQIRPVICWQKGWIDLVSRTLLFVDRYYGGKDSRSEWTDVHTVNYYFFGGSSSAYWSHREDHLPTNETIWNDGEWNEVHFAENLFAEAAWAHGFGLEFLAYEGDNHPHFTDDEELYRSIHWDERMYEESYNHVQAFAQVGGSMFAFLALNNEGPVVWGAYNRETGLAGSPQYRAVLDLAAETVPEPTFGPMAPVTIPGFAFDMHTIESPNPDGTGAFTVIANEAGYSVGYLFRTPSYGECTLSLNLSSSAPATFILDVQGNTFFSGSLLGDGEATVSIPNTFICKETTIHGIRVAATEGSVTIESVTIGFEAQDKPMEQSSSDYVSSEMSSSSCDDTSPLSSSMMQSSDATASLTIRSNDQWSQIISPSQQLSIPSNAQRVDVYTLFGQKIGEYDRAHLTNNSLHLVSDNRILYVKYIR
ncbi:MAG: fibronectin type III domain-containing protein [Fibrobacterales bacterium]